MDYARFNHGKSRKVLLDILEHARSPWAEGNRNVLHGLEEIVDRVKST
jgi:hypothetical protein